MIYVAGFFDNIDDISNILSVICGLYRFRNEIFFSENSTLSQF